MNNTKIAVCISGAFRGNISVLEGIFKQIIQPLDADVFIHTWDTHYDWPGLCGDKNIVYRLFGADIVPLIPEQYRLKDGFSKAFPNIYSKLAKEKQSTINIEKIKKYIDFKSIELSCEADFISQIAQHIDCKGNHISQLKMFYSLYKANELMHSFEKDHNVKYDFVVRIRPDIAITTPLCKAQICSLREHEVLVEFREYGPQDQLFIASSGVMDTICNIWPRIVEHKKLSFFKNYQKQQSHLLLLLWLMHNNIYIKNLSVHRKSYAAVLNMLPDLSEEIKLDVMATPDLLKNKNIATFFEKISQSIPKVECEAQSQASYLPSPLSNVKFDIDNTHKLIKQTCELHQTYSNLAQHKIFLSQYVSYVREFNGKAYEILKKFYASETDLKDVGDIAIHLAYEKTSNFDKKNFTELREVFNFLTPGEIARLFRSIPYFTNKKILSNFLSYVINTPEKFQNQKTVFYYNILMMSYATLNYNDFIKILHSFKTLPAKISNPYYDNLITSWLENTTVESQKANDIKNIKVAICISGQIRGFEECIKHWIEIGIFSNASCEVFIDTWNTIGTNTMNMKVPSSVGRKFNNKNFVNILLSLMKEIDIYEKYPTFTQACSNTTPVTCEYIKNIFKKNKLDCALTINIDDEDKFSEFSNQEKMLYKIENCFKLIGSKQYDLVVRIRPDLLLKGNIDYNQILSIIKPGLVFSNFPMTTRKNIEAPDQFFIALQKDMDKVANSYEWIKKSITQRIPYTPNQIFAHTSLAYCFFNTNIFIEKLQSIEQVGLVDYTLPFTQDDEQIYQLLREDICKRDIQPYDISLLNSVKKNWEQVDPVTNFTIAPSQIQKIKNIFLEPWMKKKAYELCNSGELEKAKEFVKSIIVNNPKFSWTYYILGKVQWEEGSMDIALKNIQKAIDLDPKQKHYHKYKVSRERIYQLNSLKHTK